MYSIVFHSGVCIQFLVKHHFSLLSIERFFLWAQIWQPLLLSGAVLCLLGQVLSGFADCDLASLLFCLSLKVTESLFS